MSRWQGGATLLAGLWHVRALIRNCRTEGILIICDTSVMEKFWETLNSMNLIEVLFSWSSYFSWSRILSLSTLSLPTLIFMLPFSTSIFDNFHKKVHGPLNILLYEYLKIQYVARKKRRKKETKKDWSQLVLHITYYIYHFFTGVITCKIHLFAYKCVFAVCGHNHHTRKKNTFTHFFFFESSKSLKILNNQAVWIFWAIWCHIAHAPPTTTDCLKNSQTGQ